MFKLHSNAVSRSISLSLSLSLSLVVPAACVECVRAVASTAVDCRCGTIARLASKTCSLSLFVVVCRLRHFSCHVIFICFVVFLCLLSNFTLTCVSTDRILLLFSICSVQRTALALSFASTSSRVSHPESKALPTLDVEVRIKFKTNAQRANFYITSDFFFQKNNPHLFRVECERCTASDR